MNRNSLKSPYLKRCSIKKIILSVIIFTSSFILSAGANTQEIKNDDALNGKKNFIVIGQNEKVIISNPESDKEVQVLAKIDTGADRTAIGTKLAKTLELDLDEPVRTVRVISSSGQQKRPLVNVVIQLAGKTIETAVSVTDRDELSTQMILGRDALSGFLVNISQDQVTSPKDKK